MAIIIILLTTSSWSTDHLHRCYGSIDNSLRRRSPRVWIVATISSFLEDQMAKLIATATLYIAIITTINSFNVSRQSIVDISGPFLLNEYHVCTLSLSKALQTL